MPLKWMHLPFPRTFSAFTCPMARFWILYLLHRIRPRRSIRIWSDTHEPGIPRYGRDIIWPPRRFGIKSRDHQTRWRMHPGLYREYTRFWTSQAVMFWQGVWYRRTHLMLRGFNNRKPATESITTPWEGSRTSGSATHRATSIPESCSV